MHAESTSDGSRAQASINSNQSWQADVVRYARIVPLDVVEAKGNGHGGTAVGVTPALYELFANVLRHDPADPDWIGRDRFILSAGHTSLSLYLQLFLAGYGLEMDDLRSTRKLGSRTPGHPELGITPGVEYSTGPLGQGVAAAVGVAMEERRVREMLTPGAGIDESPFGYRTWCFASDGDMLEGISSEAAALAGVSGTPGLIIIWDDNSITIEGSIDLVTREDIAERFANNEWRVLTIDDAEDILSVRNVFEEARDEDTAGRPTLIRLRSRIGHPMPTIGGTSAAHAGPVGASELAATKQILGLNPEESFVMPDELLSRSRAWQAERGRSLRVEWDSRYNAWRDENPELASLFDRLRERRLPEGWFEKLPLFADVEMLATRSANKKVMASLVEELPEFWGGSADLGSSTSTDVFIGDTFSINHAGRGVYFGIREHAMAAALNGMSLSGLTRLFGSTYLVFSDYQRPSLRLAALMGLPPLFIYSHDSLAVGEDGPTHEPVEQIAALRSIPNLAVVRPADAWETRAVWHRLLEKDEAHALVLTRQAVPVLSEYCDEIERGAHRGGYVIADFSDLNVEEDLGKALPDSARGMASQPLSRGGRAIVLASGSEVHLALEARRLLAFEGISVRVVSMPSLEWFAQESREYREGVLPADVRARVSVEAGIADPWYKFVGLDGTCISVENFGRSGDGATQLTEAGFTVENVMGKVREVLDSITTVCPH